MPAEKGAGTGIDHRDAMIQTPPLTGYRNPPSMASTINAGRAPYASNPWIQPHGQREPRPPTPRPAFWDG